MKGVVSTDLIDRVKARTGGRGFYICPTPDGFSGIVLAGEVEDFAFTNEPLSIGGTTLKSQGKNYQRTDAQSRKEAQTFFQDNADRPMHRELASQPYSPLVTLMTADYLLTAKDLPGWPGVFSPMSFENLIRESFKFIDSSPFEGEVLVRELRILRAISLKHGILDVFETLVKTSRRKMIKGKPIYGFVITALLRFDGTKLGIQNIYDGAMVIPALYRAYNAVSFRLIFTLVVNSFRVLRRSLSYSTEKYPREF
jgi:hypothetical protein